MKSMVAVAAVCGLLLAAPARAQLSSLGKVLQKGQEAQQALTVSEADEKQIGSTISAKLRAKYGVVQDPAVHKYITLVGTVLAQQSTRPNIDWTFVVLDTDGVNAFAAPGGFIHITRGALALIQNEAELANVLGHEISHVTEKHTINAIKKQRVEQKVTSAGAAAAKSQFLSDFANAGYAIVIENHYDRNQEKDADRLGVALANRVGYSPNGLSAFLTRLENRDKDLQEPSGLFASHPDMKDRIDTLGKLVPAQHLMATAVVEARYHASIGYKPAAVGSIPAATPTSGGGKLGISGLSALGNEKSSNQTIASAGSRGVNADRDAPGGPNKGLVTVTVTAAEIAEFKKGISG